MGPVHDLELNVPKTFSRINTPIVKIFSRAMIIQKILYSRVFQNNCLFSKVFQDRYEPRLSINSIQFYKATQFSKANAFLILLVTDRFPLYFIHQSVLMHYNRLKLPLQTVTKQYLIITTEIQQRFQSYRIVPKISPNFIKMLLL